MEAPNILVLDEPTNDLDIQTLTILEDYLMTFPGIVVTVSHDRYFLDKIDTRIFSFENGTIRQYEGNFSDYLDARQLRGENNESAGISNKDNTKQKQESIASWKQKDVKLKFSYQEQKEYDTIDEDIAALEAKIAETEEGIAKAANDYSKLNELMAAKEALEKALEEKMDRWVYLNDLAEQIEAAKKER
jgi:ATP-binding cassette subfamily F protein uup